VTERPGARARQKIAIIGGGTAGLVTAYLLSGRHEVTLFEAERSLGGNVRTLNVNVPCAGLDAGLTLDAGVIEFEESTFHGLGRLFDELKVERHQVPGTTAMFPRDGRPYRSPANIAKSAVGIREKLHGYARLAPLALPERRFLARIRDVSQETLYRHPIGVYFDESAHSTWLRMLLMYAYSIDYAVSGEIPAALAVPTLRAFIAPNRWTGVHGGAYAYVQRIVEAMQATIHLDSPVVGVSRTDAGVALELAAGGRVRFDAVVIATTPERVLELLRDPTPPERSRFGDWRPHPVRTVVHRDVGPYVRRGVSYFSEFDVFETERGAGYNAYLNRLSGIPEDHPHHYFLAFDLDEEIDPSCILHEQHCRTPSYSVAALRWREDVIASNGENRTYFAGAWLHDGLQEGAVQSALRVSERLGGRLL
jgi:predicted NAD/FAD-binding protein